MAVLDNRCVLGVGDRNLILPAPEKDSSLEMTPWGQITQLVNGANGAVLSGYAAQSRRITWTHLLPDQFEALKDLLLTAGRTRIRYVDCLNRPDRNVLSPLLGKPYLLAETLSPVAFAADGTALAEKEPRAGDGPTHCLHMTGAATTAPSSYTEEVMIPPGYTFYVQAAGDNTNKFVFRDGSALDPWVTKIVPNDTDNVQRAKVTIKPAETGGEGRLHWVRGVLSAGSEYDANDPHAPWSLFRNPTFLSGGIMIGDDSSEAAPVGNARLLSGRDHYIADEYYSDVKGGDRIDIEVKAKVLTGTDAFRGGVRYLKANGSAGLTDVGLTKKSDLANGWGQWSGGWTVPADAVKAGPWLHIAQDQWSGKTRVAVADLHVVNTSLMQRLNGGPDITGYAPPAGFTQMVLDPGSFSVEANKHYYKVDITLKESWPWQ